jgi:hypothetical protein
MSGSLGTSGERCLLATQLKQRLGIPLPASKSVTKVEVGRESSPKSRDGPPWWLATILRSRPVGYSTSEHKCRQVARESRPPSRGTTSPRSTTLAFSTGKMGRTRNAIASFEYGIGAAPDNDILNLNLGRTCVSLGDRSRARDVMQRLLDRTPGSAAAPKALRDLEVQ